MKVTSKLGAIAVAISGVVASQSIPLLESWTTQPAIVIGLSAVVSILVYHIIVFIFHSIPKRIGWLRRLIDNRGKYEGMFIEIKNIDNNRCYAIVCIAYDRPTDSYLVSGSSIEQDGTINTQWKSSYTMIDDLNKRLVYAQNGHLTDTAEGKIFEGVTYMNFDHTLNKKPDMGFGHFIDTIPGKSDFAFQRITKKDCLKYVKKKKLIDRNDYSKFVVNFHEENSDRIFTWEHQAT